jgi:hypothetical protein
MAFSISDFDTTATREVAGSISVLGFYTEQESLQPVAAQLCGLCS